MPYRKTPLVNDKIYHIYNKSIAGYKIFSSNKNYERMLKSIVFHMIENPPSKFHLFLKLKKKPSVIDLVKSNKSERIVRLVAYCFMPTHYHIIVQQLKNGGISRYAYLIQKSYSEFFNIKYKRKGPLWEGRFQNALVGEEEYFLHLTRYIHLNPTTAGLIEKPEDWKYSSYKEYLNLIPEDKKVCDYSNFFNMGSSSYKEFANDRVGYQKELAKIKHLILEETP